MMFCFWYFRTLRDLYQNAAGFGHERNWQEFNIFWHGAFPRIPGLAGESRGNYRFCPFREDGAQI